ncbi:sialidase family protein [Roseiconus lacunae]|uniref:exo-alpha-sialidase n=1 Tax=Roseiconus lacunae TaxID=2605694 RepID=A0ABT7PNM6_9BACT|nr:sialidase family protein [Roseiconus lacunae]MDM4018112.1 sialidase family protein [Roseiconus lacunae]
MFRSNVLTSAACLVLLLTAATVRAEYPTTTIFRSGDNGYRVFRIPAVIAAANGDLLAFAEARQGGDASEIDLVQKTSLDGGKTWGELVVIQESDHFRSLFADDAPAITIGNPAPVVDLLNEKHPGRIWLPFTLENDRVFVVYSDDHGKQWSERREITQSVKKEEWGWYATGPVQSIQIQNGPHRGRLVIPADHRLGDDGKDRGALGAHLVYSDDHGQSWEIGAIDDDYEDTMDSNETAVVELSDGTLYINTRDQHGKAPGTRGEAWSRDGGLTFESRHDQYPHFRPTAEVLDPPVVQCGLLRTVGDVVVLSGPDDNGPSGTGRSDLRLRFSRAGADDWQDGPLVHTGPAAYSGMVQIDYKHIGVIYEAGSKSPYESIRFSIVPVAEFQ